MSHQPGGSSVNILLVTLEYDCCYSNAFIANAQAFIETTMPCQARIEDMQMMPMQEEALSSGTCMYSRESRQLNLEHRNADTLFA